MNKKTKILNLLKGEGIMIKLIIISAIVGLFCLPVFSQMGDNIKVYKIDVPPTMDGVLSEWDEGFNVGGFTSMKNVVHVDSSMDIWKGFETDYQAEIYLAHDDTYFYMAWKTLVDDNSNQGTTYAPGTCADNIKPCFGSTQDVFYFWNAPLEDGVNPEVRTYPYDLQVGVTPGALPIYEVRLITGEVPRYNFGDPPTVNINFMTEDYDNDGGICNGNFLGLGLNYPENMDRIDGSGNPWENSLYYPVLQLVDEFPPGYVPSSIKSNVAANKSLQITASPNPFNAATNISYNMEAKGELKIYNAAGLLIKSYDIENSTGSVSWDGRDASNARAAAGVYIARLSSGAQVHDTRLMLLK
jgi:hypothetical protein